MSVELAITALLYNATDFRVRVRAAVTEHALELLDAGTTGGAKPDSLAQVVVSDPESMVGRFAALCADDAVISTAANVAAVEDEDLRRVVAARWELLEQSTPGL